MVILSLHAIHLFTFLFLLPLHNFSIHSSITYSYSHIISREALFYNQVIPISLSLSLSLSLCGRGNHQDNEERESTLSYHFSNALALYLSFRKSLGIHMKGGNWSLRKESHGVI